MNWYPNQKIELNLLTHNVKYELDRYCVNNPQAVDPIMWWGVKCITNEDTAIPILKISNATVSVILKSVLSNHLEQSLNILQTILLSPMENVNQRIPMNHFYHDSRWNLTADSPISKQEISRSWSYYKYHS